MCGRVSGAIALAYLRDRGCSPLNYLHVVELEYFVRVVETSSAWSLLGTKETRQSLDYLKHKSQICF